MPQHAETDVPVRMPAALLQGRREPFIINSKKIERQQNRTHDIRDAMQLGRNPSLIWMIKVLKPIKLVRQNCLHSHHIPTPITGSYTKYPTPLFSACGLMPSSHWQLMSLECNLQSVSPLSKYPKSQASNWNPAIPANNWCPRSVTELHTREVLWKSRSQVKSKKDLKPNCKKDASKSSCRMQAKVHADLCNDKKNQFFPSRC